MLYPALPPLSPAKQELVEEILELRRAKRVVLLAHNYQRPEIQALADFVGDSLGLSRQAAAAPEQVIIFCGVHFMAETAHILAPEKTVLMPDPRAGCPLADTITADDVKMLKEAHPGVPVVSYVNSSAAVKAESDICCTSANAVAVVRSLPGDEAIFVPDKHLAYWVQGQVSKRIIAWPGYCPTHHKITRAQVEALLKEHPEAEFIAHPECQSEVLDIADAVLSTSGMYEYARSSRAPVIIIGSEQGLAYRLGLENPDKTFLFPSKQTICPNMKLTTLKKLRDSLAKDQYEITLPEDVRLGARQAVERMVAIG